MSSGLSAYLLNLLCAFGVRLIGLAFFFFFWFLYGCFSDFLLCNKPPPNLVASQFMISLVCAWAGLSWAGLLLRGMSPRRLLGLQGRKAGSRGWQSAWVVGRERGRGCEPGERACGRRFSQRGSSSLGAKQGAEAPGPLDGRLQGWQPVPGTGTCWGSGHGASPHPQNMRASMRIDKASAATRP